MRPRWEGKNWHFGHEAHTGVDAGSGLVHTVVVTPANESDISQAHKLFRPDDGFGYADAGYTGMGRREEFRANPDLATMGFQISARPSSMRAMGDPAGWDKRMEKMKSAVRSKVEHPYQIHAPGAPRAHEPVWQPRRAFRRWPAKRPRAEGSPHVGDHVSP